jgi:site-specific DNA-methyltransferase (adenine-specific)/adenine-specific DNA-methyltransferase
MPELNWIGKQAVRAHHREVDFHLLKDVPELACTPPTGNPELETGNLIVQGDNLLALKALLPRYAGQVKCIYIDPPYNTGNEGWVYNDNVKAPEIQKWLHQVVGKEAEDLSRHDKWLCMMYPRLQLLKRFLREDGAIFVSIDDNEVATLRLLMDEVFGPRNFVTTIAWHKRVSPANDAKYFSTDLDFVLVYAQDIAVWRPRRLAMNSEQLGNYRNPDNDDRGDWNSSAYTCAKTAEESPNLYYPLIQPNTGEEIWPSKTRVWAYERETHQVHVLKNMIYWGGDGRSTKPRLKKFLTDAKLVVPRSFWTPDEAGHNQEGKLELNELGMAEYFATPKPTRFLQRILQIATDKDSLVLDSFAGSGTTGHAVLKQNAEDGGTRRFILVEMEEKIARTITAERVRRVVAKSAAASWSAGASEARDRFPTAAGDDEGATACESGVTAAAPQDAAAPQMALDFGGSVSAAQSPLPAAPPMPGFRFAVLGDTLFDAEGNIRETVTFAELAEFVWFQQTGAPMARNDEARMTNAETRSPLLGIHRGTAVYLLFNGILKDKSVGGGNVLTRPVLYSLPEHDGPKVVWCAACRISELHQRRLDVTPKQLPYHLEVNAWL